MTMMAGGGAVVRTDRRRNSIDFEKEVHARHQFFGRWANDRRLHATLNNARICLHKLKRKRQWQNTIGRISRSFPRSSRDSRGLPLERQKRGWKIRPTVRTRLPKRQRARRKRGREIQPTKPTSLPRRPRARRKRGQRIRPTEPTRLPRRPRARQK